MANLRTRCNGLKGAVVKLEFTVNNIEVTWWLRMRMVVSRALITLALWLIGAGVDWEGYDEK